MEHAIRAVLTTRTKMRSRAEVHLGMHIFLPWYPCLGIPALVRRPWYACLGMPAFMILALLFDDGCCTILWLTGLRRSL